MSDETIRVILDALTRLEAHYKRMEAGQNKLPADLTEGIERLQNELTITRVEIMARIDRAQNALPFDREEKVVDQASILLMYRQIQHLQDRITALEQKSGSEP